MPAACQTIIIIIIIELLLNRN